VPAQGSADDPGETDVADTRWQIQQACPQCGSLVEANENERVLVCTACHTRLCLATDDVPRVCLPPRNASVGSIVMVPYWHGVSHVYRVTQTQVTSTTAEYSRLACAASGLPPVLPAALCGGIVRYAAASLADRYLAPLESSAAAVVSERSSTATAGVGPTMGAGAAAGSTANGTRFEVPIVASQALVYYPVRLAGAVFDAVQSRRLDVSNGEEWLARAGSEERVSPTISFLNAMCPICQMKLGGFRESRVQVCPSCQRGWTALPTGLNEVDYSVLALDAVEPQAFAPFWRVEAEFDGLELRTRNDLIRFAKLPTTPRPEWATERLRFWIPAFGPGPDLFLRYAKALTLARTDRLMPAPKAGQVGEATALKRHRLVPGQTLPVTLPVSALENALRALLSDLVQLKALLLPRIEHLRTTRLDAHLAYLPLCARGGELGHPDVSLAMPKSMLRRGRQ
jgi:hypothetical protein